MIRGLRSFVEVRGLGEQDVPTLTLTNTDSIFESPRYTKPLMTKNHQPPQLPSELWAIVFEYLDSNDVKSARLVWRCWRYAGARFLFQPWVFRADHDDLAALERLSQNAEVSKAIHSLRFELGSLPIVYAPHNIGCAYIQEQHRRGQFYSHEDDFVDMMEQHESLHQLSQDAVEEYAAWNSRWHEARQRYRDEAFTQSIITKVGSLERIDISYKSCPLKSVLGMDA